MTRYTNDIQTTRGPEEIEKAVAAFMSQAGFLFETIEGEMVWKKGSGWLVWPQFFKIKFSEGNIHLEGWLKAALLPGVYLGEFGATGLFGAIPKKLLRDHIKQLEEVLGA